MRSAPLAASRTAAAARARDEDLVDGSSQTGGVHGGDSVLEGRSALGLEDPRIEGGGGVRLPAERRHVPGVHSLDAGAAEARLGDRPFQGSAESLRSVDSDDDSIALLRRSRLVISSDDGDWSGGVMEAGLAHRTDEETAEAAESP